MVKTMDKLNELKTLEKRLMQNHPNWPAGKARWLAEMAVFRGR
jgi:hypothetical protein